MLTPHESLPVSFFFGVFFFFSIFSLHSYEVGGRVVP